MVAAHLPDPVSSGLKPVKLLSPVWRSAAVTVLQTSDTVLTDQPSTGRKPFLRTCTQAGAGAETATTAMGFEAAITERARAAPGVTRIVRMRA